MNGRAPDDLTEDEMREIIIAQLGGGFDYKGGDCNCDKCKIYRSLQEMWGGRPLPSVIRRDPTLQQQEERIRLQRESALELERKLELERSQFVKALEEERLRERKIELDSCRKCGAPAEICNPPRQRSDQLVCEYCLKCPGCERKYETLEAEGIEWVWPYKCDFMCRPCYTNCIWCGAIKEKPQLLCDTCTEIDIMTKNEHKKKLKSQPTPTPAPEPALDGFECLICCEEFKVGQRRFRACSSRPDVHAVCSYKCANFFKEHANKEHIEKINGVDVVGKKGCPACRAPVNEQWNIY